MENTTHDLGTQPPSACEEETLLVLRASWESVVYWAKRRKFRALCALCREVILPAIIGI